MKKILMIISLVLIVGFFVFGITYYRGVYNDFQYDGYVIETSTNEKQYFLANSKYKVYERDGIAKFNNSDNEEKSISTDTFIHYLDGSASVLSKSAIVDLSEMNKKSFEYYSLYLGSVLTKTGNDYKISYLDKQLTFNEFLLKTSNNKYMIVSPTLKIDVDGKTQDVKSGFIELTFVDGNIVKLQNQEINIQNVPDNVVLSLNADTTINLKNKKIYYKGVEKINLGEITINSDDNIEIVPDENNTIINNGGSKTTEANTTSNDNGNNTSSSPSKIIHQGDFEEVASGIVDAAEIEIEKVVEDNAAIKDAVFNIEEFEVTANSVNAKVGVTDEAAVLTGTLYIKIIKASTNEVVYYEQDNTGSNSIEVEVMSLVPNTNYILIMNRDYVKNNITYNKDFVQKTFVTSSLGVSAEIDYLRTDEVSVNIVKNDYSKVTKLGYKLVDNTIKQEVDDGEVEFNDNNSVNLDFLNLESNHNVTLSLFDFVYGNTIINISSDEYNYNYNTLKQKPVISNTSFSVDKKNSKFVVYLNNITDKDSGIKQYRADVYEASTNKYVTSKTSNTNANIEFQIDGTLLNRNTNYRVYTYLIFDDNQIEYEIPIGSETIAVTGVEGPAVTFYSDNITFERIQGRIVILDPNSTINTSEKVYVSYQNLSVGAEPIVVPYELSMAGDQGIIEFDRNNLRANDSYLFTVKASVDYHDGNGYTLVDISQFIVQTGMPTNFTVKYNDRTSEFMEQSFYVETQLAGANDVSAALEASTMKSIMFKLYSTKYDKATECIPSNECWTKRYYDQNTDDNNDYNSSLKEDYYDTTFKITQDTLGVATNEITYGQYFIEILGAYDYTDYKNELPIILEEPILISANNATGSVTNKNVPVNVEYIYNEGTYDFLDNNTQIGFNVTANIVANVRTDSIVYRIFDAETNRLVQEKTVVSEDGTVPSVRFDLSNEHTDSLIRGKEYYFQFTINYTIDSEGKTEESEESIHYETVKQPAIIEIYQSDRKNGNVEFNYTFKDIDYSVSDSKLYYYKNSSTNNFETIDLVRTNDTEGTISIPFTNGTLHAYVKRKLKDSANLDTINLINYYFADEVSQSEIGNIIYTINSGNNLCSIQFTPTTIQQRNVVGYDITLSNGSKSVEFKNVVPDTSNKVDILFSDIKKLISPSETDKLYITANIKAYYDTGIYGINAQNKGSGYALQLTNYSYTKFNNKFAFNKDAFDSVNKSVTYSYIHDSSIVQNLTYELENGYMEFNSNKTSIKVLDSKNATCSENCSFYFSAITPTMEVTRETVGVTTFNFAANISGIEDEYIPNFKIVADTYLCSNDSCSSNELVSKTWFTLDEFNNSANIIRDLDVNKTYRVYYYWTINDTDMHEFFFKNTNDSTYYSTFTTKNNIGISNAYAYYRGSYYYNTRELFITYLVSVLEGYDGVDYYMYYIENGVAHEAMTISSDSLNNLILGTTGGRYTKRINIKHILEAGKTYYIDVRPYYIKNGEKKSLVAENGIKFNFTIQKPGVTVSRISDISNNSFSIRVLLKDTYNVLGEYQTFKVFTESNGVRTEIGQGTSGQAVVFDNVVCSGDSCDIIVQYKMDRKNLGTYTTTESVHTIALLNDIYIGNASVTSISDTTKIRISFTDSYKLTQANNIVYTIYDEEFNVVSSVDSFTPTWGETSNTVYLDLPENLQPGSYTIQLQVYYNTDLVGNASLDYVKG